MQLAMPNTISRTLSAFLAPVQLRFVLIFHVHAAHTAPCPLLNHALTGMVASEPLPIPATAIAGSMSHLTTRNGKTEYSENDFSVHLFIQGIEFSAFH